MLGLEELLAIFRPSKGCVPQFEQKFAERFHAAKALAFPYGRSALWAFFNAVELENAEVIMPPYTCSVVAHAIALSGNQPRFVDIRLSDYNMDLEKLPAAINERTRAIVVTHLFGYPMNVDRIRSIVTEAENTYGHKIWVIQDCAHSFDAEWARRPVATEGDVALYGLNISKTITSVFGGMLTFQDEHLASLVRKWRDTHFGKPRFRKSFYRRIYLLAVYCAFQNQFYAVTRWLQENTRLLDGLAKEYHLDDKIHFPPDHLDQMLDFEARVGLIQLDKYDRIIALRRSNARWYDEHLDDGEWILPPIVDGATYSHYPVRTSDRDALIDACANEGVELGRVIDYSIAELTSYESVDPCPNSAVASRSVLNLPLTVSASELNRVRQALQLARTNLARGM
jgi:dTDP-4-amino-4,6-dideoxygalactose transaminase